MRRRFVIGIEGLNEIQQTRFREFIAKKGAWWHWIDNMWLLTTRSEDVSAKEIRDQVLALNGRAKVVVIEFPDDITWASSGTKNAQGKKISDWLRSPWGDAD